MLVAVGVAFLVIGWSRIEAPFGDSDEGINTAVWANDSRALRELGPVDSRLGGLRLDHTIYASHPPLIVLETAAAETVFGERGWATRMAAWLGTLAAVVLLYRLLRRAEIEPVAAGAAVAATAASPLLFVYGPMLDTPVTSFPFGVLVVLVWYRQWRAGPREHPVHPALVALAAGLAALSGWQPTVLVAMCVVSLGARTLRRRPGSLIDALPFAVGGLIGLALSLGWARWAYGSFDVLADKFGGRSGESNGVGLGDMVSFQLPWLLELLGLSVIGFGACLFALRDKVLRPLAAMSLGIVVVYAVVFREAAAGHQYWNYWALLPTGVGFGYAFERMVRALRGRSPRSLMPVAVLVVCCAVLAAYNLGRETNAEMWIVDGHVVAERLIAQQARERGAGGHVDAVWYLGEEFRPDAWVTYYAGVTPTMVRGEADLRQLAARDPEALVVVLGSCDEQVPEYALCRRLLGTGPTGGPGIVETARNLVSRLGSTG